jgi:hypothetical protein
MLLCGDNTFANSIKVVVFPEPATALMVMFWVDCKMDFCSVVSCMF